MCVVKTTCSSRMRFRWKRFCCPKHTICGNGVCCQNNNAYDVNGQYECRNNECQKPCGKTYCEEHETCDVNTNKCSSKACTWANQDIPTYTPLMMTGKTCKNNDDCPYGKCNQEEKCQIDTFGILEAKIINIKKILTLYSKIMILNNQTEKHINSNEQLN